MSEEAQQEICEETPSAEPVTETVTYVTEEEEVEYCCPPEFDTCEELCKMFVGGLGKETTDEELKTMFDKFGAVKEAIIPRRGDGKSDRLFGFVTFAKCDSLDDCLLERPHKYKEKQLDVKRAVPKGQTDGSGHYKVKKLHLGNVPPSFDTAPLLRYLKSRHSKKYGTIEEIDILKSKDDAEKNRGFGFITVSNEDLADRISIAESKFILDGNSLRINKAKPRASEAGAQRGGFKGKGQSFRGGRQGGGTGSWDNWGYGGYGYGYGEGYGYGGYDYYGYPSYASYGPPRGGGYGRRFAPY